MVYCPNVSCPGRVFESIVHFASRGAMDIRGLGPERVKALLDAKLIRDVADLYEITPMQLLTLEGFAEKSAGQLVAAIQASKRQPLSTLLFALGIRHVGAQGARPLARHFGKMEALATASADEINQIRGIGEAIAAAVAGFFAEPKNRRLIDRLEQLGLNMTEPVATEGRGPLAGQAHGVPRPLPALAPSRGADEAEAAWRHVNDRAA